MNCPTSRAELARVVESDPSLNSVYQDLLKTIKPGDAAHDLAHLQRVALSTAKILSSLASESRMREGIAAAFLHDLVNVPKNHPDRAKASELSAEAAKPILQKAGFAPEAVAEIQTAIRQHSFSRGESPSTLLAKALQDADRLEALGAIGIMRVFSTAPLMGSKYFHAEDPWARNRPLDDRQFAVDHFFTKLFRLPETMQTEAGKQEAKVRMRCMQEFLDSLGEELGDRRVDGAERQE